MKIKDVAKYIPCGIKLVLASSWPPTQQSSVGFWMNCGHKPLHWDTYKLAKRKLRRQLPIINDQVHPETEVWSDKWRVYQGVATSPKCLWS